MSHTQKEKLAPFISVLILVAVAVSYVFFKMEVVRAGYELVSVSHAQKVALHERASLEVNYARLTRPQRLDFIATQRLALNRAQKNQVVLMAAQGDFGVRQ